MKSTHEQFVFYGKTAREWMRKCVLLLPEIDRLRIWEKKGYSSIYEYAAKLAGMSRWQVEDALRILKKIEDKPELKKVVEQRGINSVRPIATIATPETAGFWARKASKMSKNALESYVKEFRTSTGSQPAELTISLKLKSGLAKRLDKLKHREDFEELLEKFIDSIDEKPEPIKTESRCISTKIKKYVINKTGGKCACCNRQATTLHHTNRFAQHHEHDPDNLVSLCDGHHQLAHLGLIANEHDPPEEWQVRQEAQPCAIDLKWQQFAGVG